ncbi:MAG: hypothetical protein S4CHLAM37_15130 [Chlamydiia bacterium]|nr:hypothetical protein [Chlamydiia bacterium]
MKHHIIAKHRRTFAIIIYGLTALFLFFEMALQVSPSIMTTQLMSEFHIGASVLGIMASFYFYSYTIMQIPSGVLFDYFGPRALVTAAALMCSLGALFFGYSHSVSLLAAGRFFMGFGSAFAFVGVLTVIARWFPPNKFAFMVGITQFLAAMGAMGGALPLAYSVNDIGWRSTISYIAYIGILLSILCVSFIRNHPPEMAEKSKGHDRVGFLKSMASIVTEAQPWWIALYAFCSWSPVAIFAALWGVPFLMRYYNIPNTKAALVTSMIWIGLSVTSPVIGWLSDKLGKRNPLLNFCAFLGLVSSLAMLYLPHIPYWLAFILLLFFGAASSGQIITFAVAKDITRGSVVSTAMGFNNMAVVLGGAILQPLVGIILSKLWGGETENGVHIYTVTHYKIALITVPICYLVGLICSLFLIKETYCRPKYDSYSDQLK